MEAGIPTCPECRIGLFHRRLVSYLAMLDWRIVSVQKFPARVCDLCKYVEYDKSALAWLQTLLETGERSGRTLSPRKRGYDYEKPTPHVDPS